MGQGPLKTRVNGVFTRPPAIPGGRNCSYWAGPGQKRTLATGSFRIGYQLLFPVSAGLPKRRFRQGERRLLLGSMFLMRRTVRSIELSQR